MAESLIDQGVSAVFGPTTSTVAMKLKPLFENESTVFLSSTVSANSLDGIDDSLFKFISVSSRAHKIVSLLLDYNNVEKIVFVNDMTNDKFAENYISEFEPLFNQRGGRFLKLLIIFLNQDLHLERPQMLL